MVARSRRKNWRRFLAKIPTFEFICVYQRLLTIRWFLVTRLYLKNFNDEEPMFALTPIVLKCVVPKFLEEQL